MQFYKYIHQGLQKDETGITIYLSYTGILSSLNNYDDTDYSAFWRRRHK
jgi:hypothetical protein